jgi:hypothetical protein
MNRFFRTTAIAAFTTALAGTAGAQTLGFYQGTAADGSNAQFTVSTDPVTNLPAITAASFGFNAPCKGESYTLANGWGYGLNADITNHKVSSTTSDPYFYIVFNAKFSADGSTATGDIAVTSPSLYPASGKPTKSVLCVSPKQSFTVTYQGATPPSAKAPAHLLYDRLGRVIGQITH